jgi:hypothetical protein
MIRYLSHKEIDKEKWDNTIKESFNGIIYALSWYLDAVSPNWEALVMDDYQAVMPLTCNQKFGIKYLRPPSITQQLGVFSKVDKDKFSIDAFIKAIPLKFKWIDIHLNHYNQYHGLGLSEHKNFELSLEVDYQTLYKAYSLNTRRNLKKSEEEGLELMLVDEIEPLIELFKKNKGAQLASVKEKYYNALRLVFKQCGHRHLAKAYMVLKNGEAIAGALFYVFKGRAIFIFSASSAEGKKSKAMFFLIDNFIKDNASKSLLLDFEGSNIESLANFYKNFGAVNVAYPTLRINRLPFWLKWAK